MSIMHTTNLKEILRVLQICDSTFPVGSFNHSYGMETYMRNGKITDPESLEKWINIFLLNQFVYTDGLTVRLAYEYLQNNNIEALWKLDKYVTIQNIARESRDGGKLVAARMSDLILDLYDISLLREYRKRMAKKESYGHPAIVFAITMMNISVSVEAAIIYYGYSIVSTQVQNAVRTVPLGQKDGQILLNKSFDILEKACDKVLTIKESDLGANIPGLEMSQINHETLIFRLFMS